MSKKMSGRPHTKVKSLDERADALLRTQISDRPTMPTAEVQALVRCLTEKQKELECQNEELRKTQVKLGRSRDHHANRFDLAPVGYVAFDQDGRVIDANLTLAKMLGVAKAELVGADFSNWIESDAQDDWRLHRQAVLAGNEEQICELRVSCANHTPLLAQLESISIDVNNVRQIRTVITHPSNRNQSLKDLPRSHESLMLRIAANSRELQLMTDVLGQISEGVMVTTGGASWHEANIVYVNGALCQITGYSAQELIGKAPRLLEEKLAENISIDHLEKELSENRSHLSDVTCCHRDGTTFDVERLVAPLLDEAGNQTQRIAIYRDFSATQRKNEVLPRISELNQNILNTAQTIVLILDVDGRIVQFNPYFEKLTGWSLDEVKGRDWFDTFIPEQDRDKIRTLFSQSLLGVRTLGNVNSISARNGRRCDISWHDAPLTSEGGEMIGLLCLGQDVTQNLAAERLLHEREERLRAVLNTASDAIVNIDRRGIITDANPATERMFGYARDELVGNNVSILMPAPYSAEHDQYIARYLTTGEARIIGSGREVVGKRRSGETFPIDLAVSEVDHLGWFTGIIRDISERDVFRKRLLQSERLAAIGEAMAGLAHESRNALQRSQVCLDLLNDQLEGRQDSLNLLASIQRAQDELHHLYEDVRAYSAPIQLNFLRCHLGEIVRKAWGDCLTAWEGRDALLEEDIASENLHGLVDPFAIGQVFRNIFENALQACSDPVRIRIRYAENSRVDPHSLSVAICDNGPGVSAEHADHVFDSFFTTKTSGTGLGMAIAQRIVQTHHGEIRLNSESEQGAEFVITLPRSQPQGAAAVNSEAKPKKPDPS